MNKSIIANPMVLTHYGWPLEKALALLAEIGFGRIELCRPDLAGWITPDLRGQLADHVADLGMALAGLNVPDSDEFQGLQSPDDVAPVLASLKREIDLAVDLRVDYLLTWEGRVPRDVSAADRHGWLLDCTVDLFQQVMQHAESRGIDVVVEVHPFTMGIDVDWLVKLIDGVDSARFGVAYDSCHYGVGSPEKYIEAIDVLGPRIKAVHLSDSDTRSSELHFPPGRGCLDMDGIVAALERIGFDGNLMVDTWLYPAPERALREGMAYIQRLLA